MGSDGRRVLCTWAARSTRLGPVRGSDDDAVTWVLGVLVNNVWSFAGEDNRGPVNAMTLQPFVNYNFPGSWYLTSSPIMA